MALCAVGQLPVGYRGRLYRLQIARPSASERRMQVLSKPLRPVSRPSTTLRCLFGNLGGLDFGADHGLDSGLDHSFDYGAVDAQDHGLEHGSGPDHSADQVLQEPKHAAFGVNAFDVDMMAAGHAAGLHFQSDTANPSRDAEQVTEVNPSNQKDSSESRSPSKSFSEELGLRWPPISWITLKLLLLGACVTILKHSIGAKGEPLCINCISMASIADSTPVWDYKNTLLLFFSDRLQLT